MSATLGAGGDLERLTGIASITRLPASEGFRSTSVGRRFFIFPGLSLEPEDCNKLRLEMQTIVGRSVVLTTNHATAAAIAEQVKTLDDFATYDARDIEASKADFIKENKAAAIMAAVSMESISLMTNAACCVSTVCRRPRMHKSDF